MRVKPILIAALLVILGAGVGCREEGGDKDIGRDGLYVDTGGGGGGSSAIYAGEHKFRVTTLEIDDNALGLVGSILNGFIKTDINCGVLNILAVANGYDARTNQFRLDVGAAAVAADSPDPTTWYCQEVATASMPSPDPRSYRFMAVGETGEAGLDTTARDIPAEILDVEAGTFEVTESFDLTFPAILPGTQSDPEWLIVPLKDVVFGGTMTLGDRGQLILSQGFIRGALLKADADTIVVDIFPNDDKPGKPISALIDAVEMNYPPEAAADAKTGWQLEVFVEAEEVEHEAEDAPSENSDPASVAIQH